MDIQNGKKKKRKKHAREKQEKKNNVVEFTVIPGQKRKNTTHPESHSGALARPIKHKLFNFLLVGPVLVLLPP